MHGSLRDSSDRLPMKKLGMDTGSLMPPTHLAPA